MTDNDGSQLCDSSCIAEALGNIFKQNFNSSPSTVNDITATIRKLWATFDIIDPDFSHQNIILQLSQIKPKNSVGPDAFPSIFLKKLAPVIVKSLSILFRRSISWAKLQTHGHMQLLY